MTSSLRFSTIARRMRPPMLSSAASQLTSTNSPDPRFPVRFRGFRIRSVSLTWLMVAGPFAHVRPRDPGCTGLPSNFVMRPVPLSTYATRPHADSQLKQIVGTSA
jgi:hypothetical protein